MAQRMPPPSREAPGLRSMTSQHFPAGAGRFLCYEGVVKIVRSPRSPSPFSAFPALVRLGLVLAPTTLPAQQWAGHGGDPQHTSISSVASQPFNTVRWSTPVDTTDPGDPIYIHYGGPSITAQNTVVVPVKTASGYRLDALSGSTGAPLWSRPTDFQTAPATGGWTPSFAPTLTPSGALYYQGAGGTVYRLADPNSAGGTPTAINFLPDYAANKAAYDSSVFISTPLTSDPSGNVYFGFQATGSAPGGLKSGIAKIAPNGATTYTSVDVASGVPGANGLRLGTNSAPALSNDGAVLYIGIADTVAFGGTDYLAAVSTATLAPASHITLAGWVHDAGTSSPTVGPDGHVYFGTLPGQQFRGQLEQFSSDLSQRLTKGSFGWDETVSVVPASMVPSYHGSSSYLLFSKYNDYKEAGGNGVNKLAILDPNDTQTDTFGAGTVMKEILTIAGVTPDGPPDGAVREWCVNTAAVDPATHSIVVNSEDGTLYRWDLWTNTFTQAVELQSTGALEAYTPTAIGPDGTTYAINKSVLFAVGVPEPASGLLMTLGALGLAARRRRRS